MGAHLRIRKSLTAAAMVAFAGASTAGCGGLIDALNGETDPFSVEEGDCVLAGGLAQETDIEGLQVVDCDEPHYGEFYFVGDLDGYDDSDFYPGPTPISDAGGELCLAAFEPYVGKNYDDSEFYFNFLLPTAESWNGKNDREIACYIHLEDDGDINGSVKDSGR